MAKDNDSFSFGEVIEKEKEQLQKLEQKSAKRVLKLYDFGASKLREEIKKKPAQYFFLFISTFLGSVITSSFALFGFTGNILNVFVPSNSAKTQAVQGIQVARVSNESLKYDPMLLVASLKNNNNAIEVVDIRGSEDFQKGHIYSAKNVPIYNTNLISKTGSVDREGIKKAFANYLKSSKIMILYAHNSYSTIPLNVAEILRNEAKTAKLLSVGWEEWDALIKK